MEPQAADHLQQPRLLQSINELWTSMRALVADEVDLLAAEASVASRTLVTAVAVAVAAGVFAVLGIAALLGMIAVRIVESGFSWPAALGMVFLLCGAGAGGSILVLRGLVSRRLFAGSRRELRGRA